MSHSVNVLSARYTGIPTWLRFPLTVFLYLVPVTLVLVPVLEYRHIVSFADYFAKSAWALLPLFMICVLVAAANLITENVNRH